MLQLPIEVVKEKKPTYLNFWTSLQKLPLSCGYILLYIFFLSFPLAFVYYSSTDIQNEPTMNLDLLVSDSYLHQSPSVKILQKRIKPRPTHFLAVKVDNPQIIESVSNIQDEIAEKESEVNISLIPTSRLHITLMVMNLPKKEDVDAVIDCLSNIDWRYKDRLTPPVKLTGIRYFQNSFIFVNLADDEGTLALKELADVSKKALEASHPSCVIEEDEFELHLTIAEVATQKKENETSLKFNRDYYSHLIDLEVGMQQWNSFQLLAMQWPKGEKRDGYYFLENEFFFSDS